MANKIPLRSFTSFLKIRFPPEFTMLPYRFSSKKGHKKECVTIVKKVICLLPLWKEIALNPLLSEDCQQICQSKLHWLPSDSSTLFRSGKTCLGQITFNFLRYCIFLSPLFHGRNWQGHKKEGIPSPAIFSDRLLEELWNTRSTTRIT